MLSRLFRRKDGESIQDKIKDGRKFLPYILGPATDSWILWEEHIKIQAALDFIDQWNLEHPPELKLTLHTLLLRACAKTYPLHPRMNRFLAGKRYYQRNGIDISFSAKKEFTEAGGLLIFKRRFPPDESLQDMLVSIREMLNRDRKSETSDQEKETSLLLKLPRPLLMLGMAGVRALDFFNLLPYSFIEHNPMFASMFISNLGSLGLSSGWHHLYKFGNIALFGVMGAPYDAAVVEDGQVVARKLVSMKWTFDERIEDGLNAGRAAGTMTKFLEDPQSLL
jgi:hypothetical protein